MKKSTKVLLSIIIVLALGAAGTFGYFYFTKDKPNDDAQKPDESADAETVKYDVGDNVASVNGISIISDDTGVRVFNEADKTQKVVFDRPANCAMFDGEIAYFIEKDIEDLEVELYDWDGSSLSPEEHGPWMRGKVYSYNTKTDELKEVVLLNYVNRAGFEYVDNSSVYYSDIKDEEVGHTYPRATLAFYKYDTVTQKRTVILDDVGWHSIESGKMFYQTEASTGSGEDGYHSLYAYDFKSGSSKMISKEDAYFLKYEGDEVYFMERICTFAENDEYVEYDDVKFTLKSFNLKTNESKVVAEFDFLPDDPKIWASYVDNDHVLITGKDYDAVLYDLNDKSYKVYDEDTDKEGYYLTSGSKEFFIETLYAFDDEIQEDAVSGIAIHLCNGDDYKLVKQIDDEHVEVSKITENGAYIYSSYFDLDTPEVPPVEITFVPLEIN